MAESIDAIRCTCRTAPRMLRSSAITFSGRKKSSADIGDIDETAKAVGRRAAFRL